MGEADESVSVASPPSSRESPTRLDDAVRAFLALALAGTSVASGRRSRMRSHGARPTPPALPAVARELRAGARRPPGDGYASAIHATPPTTSAAPAERRARRARPPSGAARNAGDEHARLADGRDGRGRGARERGEHERVGDEGQHTRQRGQRACRRADPGGAVLGDGAGKPT